MPMTLLLKLADNIKNVFSNLCILLWIGDRLCGLVVRVPGYRSRGPGFDSRRYPIFWEVVGLEWGPLSLLSTTEELLGRNGVENREYGHGDPLNKSWHQLRRQVAVARLAYFTCGLRPICSHSMKLDFKRFWQWCTTFRITEFSDFVPCQVF
jgi:hypothetical protein